MGRTGDHVCPACGYKANVSGGRDAGWFSETNTVVCLQCRALYDVMTAEKMAENSNQPDATSGSWQKVAPRCPKSASHVVKSWMKSGPCPRCGAAMTFDPAGEMIYWD